MQKLNSYRERGVDRYQVHDSFSGSEGEGLEKISEHFNQNFQNNLGTNGHITHQLGIDSQRFQRIHDDDSGSNRYGAVDEDLMVMECEERGNSSPPRKVYLLSESSENGIGLLSK